MSRLNSRKGRYTTKNMLIKSYRTVNDISKVIRNNVQTNANEIIEFHTNLNFESGSNTSTD